jgi:hypothetical protein
MTNYKNRSLFIQPEVEYPNAAFIERVNPHPRNKGFADMSDNPQVIFKQQGTTLQKVFEILNESDLHDCQMIEETIAAITAADAMLRSLLKVGGAVLRGGMPVLTGTDGVDMFAGVEMDRLFHKLPIVDRLSLSQLAGYGEYNDKFPNLRPMLGLHPTEGPHLKPAVCMPGADQYVYTEGDSGSVLIKKIHLDSESGQTFAWNRHEWPYEQSLPVAFYQLAGLAMQSRNLPPIINSDNIVQIAVADIARSNGHILEPGWEKNISAEV